jgi:hypothetical protein
VTSGAARLIEAAADIVADISGAGVEIAWRAPGAPGPTER